MGGIARKSPFVMQVTADILGMPIKVAASEQAVALGAGMFAAVAAGVYPNVSDAQKKMGSGFDKTFVPDRKKVEVYNTLYKKYVSLGESLQGFSRPWEKHEGNGDNEEAEEKNQQGISDPAGSGLQGQPRAGGKRPCRFNFRQRVRDRPGAGAHCHQAQRR